MSPVAVRHSPEKPGSSWPGEAFTLGVTGAPSPRNSSTGRAFTPTPATVKIAGLVAEATGRLESQSWFILGVALIAALAALLPARQLASLEPVTVIRKG